MKENAKGVVWARNKIKEERTSSVLNESQLNYLFKEIQNLNYSSLENINYGLFNIIEIVNENTIIFCSWRINFKKFRRIRFIKELF